MTKLSIPHQINGWLNIYKPPHISSNAALYKIKRQVGKVKVGFAGTLDPMAEGVLPVAFGEATKTIDLLHDKKKAYLFSIKWGEETDTLDREGTVIKTSNRRPTKADILKILPLFIGTIDQTPPLYSAVKINGKRAYKLARKGEEVSIKSKKVTLYDLNIKTHTSEETIFYCLCEKGTYIRSLARDIAYKLQTVGHVSTLIRTLSGPFCHKDTISLEKIEKISNISQLDYYIHPVEKILSNEICIDLTEEQKNSLKFGQKIKIPSYLLNKIDIKSKISTHKMIALYKNKLVAFIEIVEEKPDFITIKPKRVFNF